MNNIRIGHQNVWFFSDPHFFHKNLCRGTSKWPDKLKAAGDSLGAQNMLERELRDFDDEIQMTDHIIDSINQRVGEDDVLFCLGDWAFGGTNKIYNAAHRINCNTLHLILGNHDKEIRENRGNIQSIFNSVSESVDVYIQGQHIVLYHYSQRIWNKSHRGSWMLYGHSHGHLPEYVNEDGIPYKTMDVGVDAIYKKFGEYRPISFVELKEIMETRVPTKIDHHR